MLKGTFRIVVIGQGTGRDYESPLSKTGRGPRVTQRVVKTFSSVPSLRPGLFYDLSTGDSCPLRIPPTSRGLRFPPLISREKHGGLPPVTQKRSQSHASSISATGVSPWVFTVKYNDGYMNEKGRIGQTVGYPDWWLKAVGFGSKYHGH